MLPLVLARAVEVSGSRRGSVALPLVDTRPIAARGSMRARAIDPEVDTRPSEARGQVLMNPCRARTEMGNDRPKTAMG
jgi:hypothetical protein